MVALNFTVFLEKVEDGTKCQSIRAATPYNRKQFTPGNLLNLYTGMRRRDYCKTPYYISGCRNYEAGSKRCLLRGHCESQGAKLLNQGPITAVQVIKFKDLTGRIALADGFEAGWQEDTCPCDRPGGYQGNCACPAISKLLKFLTTAYAAQPDTEFLIIKWAPRNLRHICDVTGHSPAKGFHHECAGVSTCESCKNFNVARPPVEGKRTPRPPAEAPDKGNQGRAPSPAAGSPGGGEAPGRGAPAGPPVEGNGGGEYTPHKHTWCEVVDGVQGSKKLFKHLPLEVYESPSKYQFCEVCETIRRKRGPCINLLRVFGTIFRRNTLK